MKTNQKSKIVILLATLAISILSCKDKSVDNFDPSKLSLRSFKGSWKVLLEKETGWYWSDNKAIKRNTKVKSKLYIVKYIFSDNTVELHEKSGNETEKLTNSYELFVDKSKFVITGLDGEKSTWEIKDFDGKKMTIHNPNPTKKEDFSPPVGGDPPYYIQLEFQLSKE